jgi:hypothetical protein
MEKSLTAPKLDPKTGKIYDSNRANLAELSNLLHRVTFPKAGRDLVYELLLDAEYEAKDN